ncbi:S8 family serine peptidase [bacterium]|nr:S8 family serine peptidase [bacterium]
MNYLLRTTLLISTSLVLAACGGAKTSESVFPATAACASGASENRFIVQWEDGRYTIEHGSSSEEFRSGFVSENLAFIKHVDNDYRIQIRGEEEVNQLANDFQTESLNWGPQKIGAPQVWAQGHEGSGVIVGVIDGMVDVNHSQLSSNIAVNTSEVPNNGIDDDQNGFIDDYKGIKVNAGANIASQNRHGTHVAGIVVADQSLGPAAGVAQRAKVLPAQFIGNDGGGSIGDAIIALNYVANRGAKIINMSWGLDACVAVPNLQATLQQLNSRGILLVTAAGNGDSRGVGINMDITPSYPSAYNFSNQLNVAASTTANFLIGFSNYGKKSVHVAAPGVSIYSTTPNNQVETMSGTSMAAPMVSGAAALLWSAEPTATAAQIKSAILQSVDRNPSSVLEVYSGGVINVEHALSTLKSFLGH